MINSKFTSSEHTQPDGMRELDFGSARDRLVRRFGTEAEQLMHAWSLSVAEPENKHVHRDVCATDHQDCPPEVYLG